MSIEHTFKGKEGLETKIITKAKAIRAYCMDCCSWQQAEVSRCTVHTCVLYPFRFGNEKGLERIYTEDENIEDEDEDM